RKNLYFLDPGKSRLTLFRLPDGQPLPIKDLFVYGLYEDKEGQLWIGTRNDGLFVLDQKRTSYSHFSHSDRDPESLINGSHLRSIVQAKDGKIWISTQNGISIFDPKTRKFNNCLMNTLQRSGITKRWVNGIVQDTLGRMWLTIDGQGLLKVEEKPENHFDFKLFDTRSGINDPAMGKMARDQYGNIWLINYGLIHINPYNETFHLFNEYNGLSDNVSVDESIYVDPEGTIYLGREGKFETKDFTEIDFSGWDIKLILESIEVNGKNIPLTAGMGDKQTILLKANQNNLTFGYGAICFRDPDQVLFQYMLEGFDRNWIMAGTGRSARYTNLSPGTYTFRYKLLNREGVQNNERSLKIVIKPFFWQTWWFIATVSVVLLLIAWVLFRYRVRQLIKVERLRTRIATDLHDDIGSTLSSISILSDLLSRETSNPKSLQMVGNISKNSRQMLEKIDDIIWVVNPTNDRFQNLSLRIREYAIPLFESKQMLFEILIDEKLSTLKLAMDVRRNIYLIAKEAINNLVKYSACKKARILFREHDPELFLEISDDGKGFDVSSPTSRNGLKNMHARAKQINARLKIASSPGNGTTIELTIQM
ncbi:MAG: hypothetical protein FJY10_12030, partial [Bacteroidetes bacterium]|nr:hypothetical protein [Bacteroidota bacterium]